MANYEMGDLVVLTAGSMRMAVERVEGDAVHCVWCHEGQIGRDSFHPLLLKKWEVREDARPNGGRPGGPRQHGGPRRDFDNDRGGRDFGDRGDRGGRHDDRGGRDFGDRPQRTGWDGKPREKKHFRKD